MPAKRTRYPYTDDWRMVRLDRPHAEKKVWPEVRINGRWIKKAPAEPLTLYRIRDVDPEHPVMVVEGEKCVDALWDVGLQAVTSAFGSKCAHKSDWDPLAECDVVLCPDLDSPGFSYIDSVAREILDINQEARLRTLVLPGMDEGSDIADFIKQKAKP